MPQRVFLPRKGVTVWPDYLRHMNPANNAIISLGNQLAVTTPSRAGRGPRDASEKLNDMLRSVRKARMSESTTIRVSRKTPLFERISEVNDQISSWLQTLEDPFSIDKDMLRLTKYERNSKEYRYSYTIYRGVSSPRPEKAA